MVGVPVLSAAFRGLPREVAVLVAVAVSVAIGFGIVAPAIPDFARSFGVGKTAAGAVISAFALMRFVSALAGGRLVDAFGERVILASGIFIVAISTGLAGLAQSYEQLLFLRGIGGVGSAMFTVSATALLFRVVESNQRGRASGLFQSGFLIGGMLGPLAGGVLTDQSLRLPFYVYAVSLLVAGGIGAVFLRSAEAVRPELQDGTQAKPEIVSTPLRQAWSHPAYRAAVVVNFAIGWAFFGVRMSLIPLFVTEAMDRRALWIGIGFLLTSVAQGAFLLVAGKFVDTHGRRPSMIFGSALAAMGLGVLALTTALWVFLLAMVVMGVGGAFVGTAPGAVVGDVMKGRGGRVVAFFQMAGDAGAIVGPLVAGALADHVSYAAALLSCAVVLAIAALAGILMPETLERAHEPAAVP
jgi:MFS family permease